MGAPQYPADPNFNPNLNPNLNPVAPAPAPTADAPTVGEFALTPEETAEADLLYEELKPMATAEARNYVLARTPAAYQEYMVTKIEADWPVPPAEDPGALVRVQGEQGRVSKQKPAIADSSPQFARAGEKLEPVRNELDTGRDANARRVAP
jgi:hypothetical protein